MKVMKMIIRDTGLRTQDGFKVKVYHSYTMHRSTFRTPKYNRFFNSIPELEKVSGPLVRKKKEETIKVIY